MLLCSVLSHKSYPWAEGLPLSHSLRPWAHCFHSYFSAFLEKHKLFPSLSPGRKTLTEQSQLFSNLKKKKKTWFRKCLVKEGNNKMLMTTSLTTISYGICGYRNNWFFFLTSCFKLQQYLKNTRSQSRLPSINNVYISLGNRIHPESSSLLVIHFLMKFCYLTAANGIYLRARCHPMHFRK